MDHLSDIMALFWTAAEGSLLLAMRWGCGVLEGRRARQGAAVTLLLAALALAALLLFGSDALVARLGGDERTASLFAWSVWGLLCAGWVALEGGIASYVLRVRSLLAGGPRAVRLRPWWVFLPFALYHAQVFSTATRHALDEEAIRRLAGLWVRACGVLWILYEWVVAVAGWRACRLLRGRR